MLKGIPFDSLILIKHVFVHFLTFLIGVLDGVIIIVRVIYITLIFIVLSSHTHLEECCQNVNLVFIHRFEHVTNGAGIGGMFYSSGIGMLQFDRLIHVDNSGCLINVVCVIAMLDNQLFNVSPLVGTLHHKTDFSNVPVKNIVTTASQFIGVNAQLIDVAMHHGGLDVLCGRS